MATKLTVRAVAFEGFLSTLLVKNFSAQARSDPVEPIGDNSNGFLTDQKRIRYTPIL